MKILHFVYDHPDNPWCGGGGAQRSWQINRLLAQRHDITVCCGAFSAGPLAAEPFKVRLLGRARCYKESRLKYILHSLRADTRPYDLIVEDFSPYSPALFRSGKKAVVTVAHYYLGPEAVAYRAVFGLGAMLNEHFLLRRRKNIIVVSEHLRDAFSPASRVLAIPPGVDLPKETGSLGEKYVLFVGRLDIKIKGLDVLIRAWSQIPDSKRHVPLHIIGEGDRKGVQALIANSGARDVNLAGRMDHKAVMGAMREAAFLCVPSRREGCGLVLYEALAMGKPVIAAAIPAFRHLVEPHGPAMPVKPGDANALQKSMERLLSDGDLRVKMAEKSGRTGRRFTWEQAAREQDAFYQTCVGRQPDRTGRKDRPAWG